MKKKYILPLATFEELEEEIMGLTGSTENKDKGDRKDSEKTDNPYVIIDEEPDPEEYDPFA